MSGVHYQYKDNIIIFVHDIVNQGEIRLTVFKNDAKYDECVDIIDENKDIFIRKYMNGFSIYIDNLTNKILYTESVIECKPLGKGRIDLIKDNKISAFDIEAYEGDGRIFIPYACGFVTTPLCEARDKNNYKLYYLTDFNNSRDMLKQCTIDMLNSDLGTVYVHNLSKFYIFFINNILKEDEDIVSDYKLNKDGKILSVGVKFKDKKMKGKFIFRDSLLLIQGSLKDITESFNTKNGKLTFPHKFVKADNLNYVGDKPDFNFYTDMDELDYESIPPKNWCLKGEALKYLKYDLISLQEVVVKFSNDIYALEKLNITKTPTTSSIAFKALTTNYLKSGLLFQVKGRAHDEMRQVYYGGGE